MSYSTLGTNCIPQTIAFTSNAKFLSPINPVYFQNIIKPTYLSSNGQKIDKVKKIENDKVKKIENNDEKYYCTSCNGSY